MQSRIGITPRGFRTPGGFSQGIRDRPDLKKMLLDLGFTWISGKYPGHKISTRPGDAAREGEAPAEPSAAVIHSIVDAQSAAQSFRYETGLVEISMSPISDIGAFRTGRWQLDSFLAAIRAGVERAIERRAAFDFLGHPSCLYVADPEFKAIALICDLVEKAGSRAALADLDAISRRVPER